MGTQESCTCDECKMMCKRACWPTPDEAQALIDAGFAHRLMCDYWIGEPNVDLICPAESGHEGSRGPNWPGKGCVFQDTGGLCDLHDLGLKPLEGRMAIHGSDSGDLHKRIAMMWDTERAQAIVSAWWNIIKKGE